MKNEKGLEVHFLGSPLFEDEIQRGGRTQPEEKQTMLVGGKPHYRKDG